MKLKLTKREDLEIERLISYYDNLGGDDNDEEDAGKSEDAILMGLTKLKSLHDKKFKLKQKKE